jgi:transcriptional regulator with XRE-family HTH domain
MWVSLVEVTAVAGADADGSRDKRRRLAGQLRLQRELIGITGRELAARIGVSQSKVSRIEAGAALPTLPEVTAWAEAVGAPAEIREVLATLAEAARTEVNTWAGALRGHRHLQGGVHEREAEAHRARVFQPSVVPGLLQTAAYARSVFTLLQQHVPQVDVSAAVAGRLDRQTVLYDEDREFEFLISEGALRWRPGPPRLLVAQLDRIASVSTLDNVSIGLIPFRALARTDLSQGFTILEGDGADSAPYVMVETRHAALTINAPDDVALYQGDWSLLRQMAVFDDEARGFLADLGAEIQATKE